MGCCYCSAFGKRFGRLVGVHLAAFWLPECRCSPGGFEGLGLAFLGCAAWLVLVVIFERAQCRLGPSHSPQPGQQSKNTRTTGFFLLCIQIARNHRTSSPSSAATVVAPGPPMSGKDGCCSLVVLPSVPPRTSRCGIPQHRESPGSNPGSVIFFLQFFCCSVLLASLCACFQACRWGGAAHGYYTLP